MAHHKLIRRTLFDYHPFWQKFSKILPRTSRNILDLPWSNVHLYKQIQPPLGSRAKALLHHLHQMARIPRRIFPSVSLLLTLRLRHSQMRKFLLPDKLLNFSHARALAWTEICPRCVSFKESRWRIFVPQSLQMWHINYRYRPLMARNAMLAVTIQS